MTEDLRPAPRLPLDTTVLHETKEGDLIAVTGEDPDTGPFQVSLLQTRTQRYFPSAFDRETYDRGLTLLFENMGEVEAVVRPVLQEFAKETPRPENL